MIRAGLVLLASAGPALAACPVPGDLDTGIRVTEGDGTVSVYRQVAPGIVEAAVTWDDGFGARNRLLHGVFVERLVNVDVEGVIDLNSVLQTTFADPPEAIDLPVAGLNGQLASTVTTTDASFAESVIYRWGDATRKKIGPCAVKIIPGEVTYANEVDTAVEELWYAPDLGFAILVGYTMNDEPKDVFEITGIEAVK